MKIDLPMASVFAPRIQACRPICERCKYNDGFAAHGSRCETHSKCTACKCPSKQVSLILGICPGGMFAGGRPIRFWEKLMEAQGYGR